MALFFGVQWLTLIALFGHAASVRTNARSYLDIATGTGEPFKLQITVKNKREVMDKRATTWFGWALDKMITDDQFSNTIADKMCEMIPQKMHDMNIDSELEKESVEGLTSRIKVVVNNIDIKELLTTAKGPEFTEAIMSLKSSLAGLGVPEKFDMIESKVQAMVRSKLMTKLPEIITEKMAGEGVQCDIVAIAEPSATQEEEGPTPVPKAPSRKMVFRVSIPDRSVMANQVEGTVKKMVIKNMPHGQFLKTVMGSMKEKVGKKMKKELDGAMEVSLATETDKSAGDNSKNYAFWLILTVADLDIPSLLKKKKGEDFGRSFESAMMALNTMLDSGMASMEATIASMNTKIETEVLGGIRHELVTKLGAQLGAQVTPVSLSDFELLQETLAPAGRCCESSGALWWVSADLANGGCPNVSPKDACKVTKKLPARQPKDTVSSHFRPFTDCFVFGNDQGVTQKAVLVEKTC